jgi:glyoxylase-like metal-dependent hydrolase (beta-lactamase superfamily II)
VSFYFAKDSVVVSGDTLFAGSIGRTDLPGGDTKTLLNAIKTQLFTLPPKTKVLSGHGGETTIEEEMRSNPFFNGAAYE